MSKRPSLSESYAPAARINDTSDDAFDLDADRLHEECGIGSSATPMPPPSRRSACTCSTAARRRPASSPSTAGAFNSERAWGSSATFSDPETIAKLKGANAIGHVRYATTGETILRNVQPLFAELDGGGFAVAHNGNLTNALTLRRQLVRDGAI